MYSVLSFITAVVVFVESGIALFVGYLLFLTCVALLAPRRTELDHIGKIHTFSILIPAHNEEILLPDLLQSIAALDYPRTAYKVYVVADNCTDRTSEIAQQFGASVYGRFNTEDIGKGFALEWLLARLEASEVLGDAIVILDADSIISKNFLRVMNARIGSGERVIQAYYAVRNPEKSWSASLRAVALSALHYLRPLARSVLGASTGLKGNGMVFATDIIRRYQWSSSLTEDIEYHMSLILDGYRVTFAADAVVWAEMPSSLAASQTQNVRWERGRQEMLRKYVPQLLYLGIKRRSFLLLDAAIEQLTPPFSILPALSFLCFVLSFALQSNIGLSIAIALIVCQSIHIFVSLVVARVPRKVYQYLLYAPIFIVWKVLLYLRTLSGYEKQNWIRTTRNDA